MLFFQNFDICINTRVFFTVFIWEKLDIGPVDGIERHCFKGCVNTASIDKSINGVGKRCTFIQADT